MMRDSPPELARALAGPYSSSRTTLLPRRARCQALHAPKTPAPITATSNMFAGGIAVASYPICARMEKRRANAEPERQFCTASECANRLPVPVDFDLRSDTIPRLKNCCPEDRVKPLRQSMVKLVWVCLF